MNPIILALQLVLMLPVIVFWMSDFDAAWPIPNSVSLVLRLASVLIVLGSLAFLIKARRDLGRAFHASPTPRADAELVRVGVYKHFRHPMYTGIQAILLAALLSSPSLWMLLAVMANTLFYQLKARYEERLLSRKYADYPAYKAETRGVWPF